jgi:hypothetical protein
MPMYPDPSGTVPGGGGTFLQGVNTPPSGAYSLISSDSGKVVVIDNALTIPTGLPIGFHCKVFLNNGVKQTLTTTGLTVNGNDANTSISANGVIEVTIIATDTALLQGEMEV